MLELRNVRKAYSGIPAVSDVRFQAPAGAVTGYLGPNGSGKSTTLKMIAGLIEPDSGEILFDGQPIARDRMAYTQRLGYVPEEPLLYSHLSGLEYLEMVGQLRGLPDRSLAAKIDAFLHLLGLHNDRHLPISAYLKGWRPRSVRQCMRSMFGCLCFPSARWTRSFAILRRRSALSRC